MTNTEKWLLKEMENMEVIDAHEHRGSLGGIACRRRDDRIARRSIGWGGPQVIAGGAGSQRSVFVFAACAAAFAVQARPAHAALSARLSGIRTRLAT